MDIGFIANPASGKDIRRLTARASVFDNQEKTAIVGRCLAGIRGIGEATIHYLPDTHNIVSSALDRLEIAGNALPIEIEGSAADSTRAAEALRGVDVVISLGGDGTNRAIAKGWLDVPLIPLSTGTNNAFPVMVEATTAGIAAAMVAGGMVDIDSVSTVSKVVHIDIDGAESDLALIDAVVTNDRFIGTRALTDVNALQLAVVSNADPSRVGMSGVAGCLCPVAPTEDAGIELRFCHESDIYKSIELTTPLAPGILKKVNLTEYRLVELDESIHHTVAGALALDGERERILTEENVVQFVVKRDGPVVVNIERTLEQAARSGLFKSN